MPKGYGVLKKIRAEGGCGEEQNSDREESAQHLRQWRFRFSRFFRFFRNHRCQRNSQTAANGLTALDFCQAVPEFTFECDRVLRTVLWIFAQHVHEQIPQRSWRPSQFG